MQKVFNFLTVLSFGVSASVVIGGAYVFANKDNIVESVKQQMIDSVREQVGSLGRAMLNPTAAPLPAEVPAPPALPVQLPFGN